ncbi:MAG: hypothetical protein LBS59_01030 [Puniceicoccales bacterium]|jgi:hypothetical protein|nr:hypothetical protein [Puniceicoccales bacterium]
MTDSLSQEQKNTVARWVAEGASLSEIQARLNTQFRLSFTYIEVRFLIDDLNLLIKDKTPAGQPADETVVDAADAYDGAEEDNAPAKNSVSVSIDPVQQPGVALGGSVTFSDGVTGQWYLDSYGQLGFVPPYKGYQPTKEDIRKFQDAIREAAAKIGY